VYMPWHSIVCSTESSGLHYEQPSTICALMRMRTKLGADVDGKPSRPPGVMTMINRSPEALEDFHGHD
jgi:hypothetical protein